MAKKKKSTTTKAKKSGSGNSFFKDPRVKKIAGLLLLLLAFIMVISFFSYIGTYKADQSVIMNNEVSTLGDNEAEVSNALGRLGAVLSHFFIYRLFGFASFVFPLLFFVFGTNMLIGRKVFPSKKITLYGIFTLIWGSIVLAYFSALLSPSGGLWWGGGFGDYLTGRGGWLTGFMSMLGVGAFIVVVSLIAAVWVFDIDFGFLTKLRMPKLAKKTAAGLEQEEGDVIVGASEESIFEKDNIEVAKQEEEKPEIKEKEDPAIELETTTPEVETPIITPPKKEEDPIPADDMELEVEEVVEEKIIESDENEGSYDPTLDLSNYKYPTLDLLEDHGGDKVKISQEELERNKNQIIQTLSHYNIEISKIKATIGPTVTLYEIVPAPGVRISKIKNLEDDIALSLAALGIRIIAPIPGKGTVGIEVPNEHKEIVSMKTMLASEKFRESKMELPIAIGRSIANEIFMFDMTKMPHLLMAGATGQGKSVGINAMLVSLLYKKHPSQLKFVLVDPKKVELSIYNMIEKHFLAKLPGEEEAIITDVKKVVATLNSLCIEMDERYELLKGAHCRNIKEYNAKFIGRKLNPQKGHRYLPYIVLVIDEFADLIMTAGKEVETPIARLAQLARAIGIHIVLATQRPSVNIITGVIKANFPARISFKVSSKVDSRTILDQGGADQLIGRGDMLFGQGSDLIRLQCGFVDTPEVDSVVKFIGDQQGYPEAFELPEYIDPNDDSGGGSYSADERDELFEDAARVVVSNQMGSTSMIQRRLKLGYNRAGRLMDQLEDAGIVGPNQGSKARDVLIHTEAELEQYLIQLKEVSN